VAGVVSDACCPPTGLSSSLAVNFAMQRRRRVLIESSKGRISAGFSVSEAADAVDVSMQLRERGWAPYRVHLDRQQNVWIVVVIDWKHAA
jgi:hypothetical protein